MWIISSIQNHILKNPRQFLTVLFLFCYTLKSIVFQEWQTDKMWNRGDALFYHFMTSSILEDQDMNLSNNHGNLSFSEGFFALSKSDYPTAKQSPLMAIAAIPFRLAIGPVGALLLNILCSLGIILFLFELSKKWATRFSALFACTVVGLCSVLFRYAFHFSPDVFSCLLLLALLTTIQNDKWILAGVLAGLACTAKVGNSIIIIPIALFCLIHFFIRKEQNWIKMLLLPTIAFLITLIPFGYYNYSLFGSAFTTGYQAILIIDENGTKNVLTHTNDFNIPFWKGFISLLFNSQNGLIKDNLLIIIPGLLGFFLIPKAAKKWGVLIGLIIGIQLFFYSKYDHQLASTHGNRFLLFSIALFTLPISWLVDFSKRKLAKNPIKLFNE